LGKIAYNEKCWRGRDRHTSCRRSFFVLSLTA
jgi:hypothetical protein